MTDVSTAALAASFDSVALPPALTRPLLTGAAPEPSGFGAFLRAGVAIETKALAGTSDAAGVVAVPEEIDAVIARTLKTSSPIRAIARVVRVGSSGYRKLVAIGGVASGWAGEGDARPETATPAFVELAPPMGDLYANPSASQWMLDDAGFDVETWLAEEIASEFAKSEGAAFVSGSGIGRPKGFLRQPVAASADAARAFGTLQYLAAGAAGDFAGSAADKLIDLMQALRAPYRQGAHWVMNAATLARLRKLKTSDGALLWAPGLAAGQPATLLGYPVIEAEDMPDIAADSLSIAFGDFERGYLITERGETVILRDPFSNKPFVHFYATRRVGGIVSDSNAIKLLRFSAA